MKSWQKFILLVLASAVVHELGHIIVGGGFVGFEYAPELDFLSTKVYIQSWDIWSQAAGFIFTLPLLFFNRWLIFLFLFQSRWDFLNIYLQLTNYQPNPQWSPI